MNTLSTLDVAGKRVLYRADYNVPLKDGVIQDPYRIQATMPTLEYLMEKGAKIIIASHLGRPDGQYNAEYDLRPVAEFLADTYPERNVYMAHEIEGEEVETAVDALEAGDILVLPNVRFYAGEEANDPEFAHKLAALGEAYVNDAFAAAHRAHASIVGVAAHLPSAAGFLLQKEIETLGGLLEDPKHPFVVLMGGAKVSDKIGVIESLGLRADSILIGGAMANTFLLAQGEEIGNSKAEEDKVDVAKDLVAKLGSKLLLASDYVKEEKNGSFSYLDIGPQSVEEFKGEIKKAKTVFWNGSLGYAEDSRFAIATEMIATYLAGLKNVTTVVAGGDTVETITKLGLHDKIGFVSTGGGAALEFLAGEKLPGVEALQ